MKLRQAEVRVRAAPHLLLHDGTECIYLEGNRKQLQPSNITVRFSGEAPTMDVDISGTFLVYDTKDETVAPRVATVVGHVRAQVK